MGTQARIGIRNEDGTVTSMYVHNDGYPEKPGVGRELALGYTTVELVLALVAKGELSTLESTLEAAHCYSDARPPITHPVDEWPRTGQEHEYLFVGPKKPVGGASLSGVALDSSPGVWFYRSDGRRRGFGVGPPIEADWRLLDEVLREA